MMVSYEICRIAYSIELIVVVLINIIQPNDDNVDSRVAADAHRRGKGSDRRQDMESVHLDQYSSPHTDTKYIIMGPTAISGDIVVPFLANRNNSMYSTALAMVGLNHYKFMDANGSGRYSVMVNNMTQAQTGLTIRVETYLNSGYAQWLGVRYLVVDLSFVYLSIHPFTLNYHNNPQAYGERSSSNLFSVDIYPTLPSYQASDRTKVMTAINGFDIQDSGGSNPDIEVEIQCI